MIALEHLLGLMRGPGEARRQVTTMELFFDLVYIFAITQLSHLLVEHLSIHGVFQTALLLLAVWWAWMYTTWFTNWFDPDLKIVRVVLVGVMLASLIMAAVIPGAFDNRGLAFAATYVVMQVGRNVFAVLALREQPHLYRNFQRILCWSAFSGAFWLAGGVAHDSAREVLWVVAILLEFAAPVLTFYTPGLGRSNTGDWDISINHMAERCQLFIIVALGESILVTGRTFGEHHITASALAAFVVSFVGSVALWWIYFGRSIDDIEEIIAESTNPGHIGRTAYTFCHLPMVAGIIVAAVGDELTIAHPGGHADTATILTVLGGPALFLLGHALFQREIFGTVSVSRFSAIAALVVLIPLGQVTPPLVLAIAATLVVAAVAWADLRQERAPLGVSATAE